MIGPTFHNAGRPMPFHSLLRSAALFLCAAAAVAADRPAVPVKEADEGWVQLFDGETTFGWVVEGPVKVEKGQLVLGGDKPATAAFSLPLPAGTFAIDYAGSRDARLTAGAAVADLKGDGHLDLNPLKPLAAGLDLAAAAGGTLRIKSLKYKPADATPLFDGKTLAGWKKFTGNPKQEKSEFGVTPAGELFIKNGPGDLQTEKQFADFVLQLECKTNGPALNSGVFFRGLPGQYQQGYEAQIQNAVLNGDRTKPVDFGTGAIYRRIAARKVAADDNEWFTLTVLAKGDRIATWVNGYNAVNWKDERKANDNARQGLRTAAGVISLQGHDPTTDLLFRNIRIVEMK